MLPCVVEEQHHTSSRIITHHHTPSRPYLFLAPLSLFLGFRQKSPMKYVRHRVNLGLLFVSCPPHRHGWVHPRGSQRESRENRHTSSHMVTAVCSLPCICVESILSYALHHIT